MALRAQRAIENSRVLKTRLIQRHREGYDDARFRNMTVGPSGIVCIPERAVPEAYVGK